ncbi:hypothetical protein D3C71_1241470 [compost metagenome]
MIIEEYAVKLGVTVVAILIVTVLDLGRRGIVTEHVSDRVVHREVDYRIEIIGVVSNFTWISVKDFTHGKCVCSGIKVFEEPFRYVFGSIYTQAIDLRLTNHPFNPVLQLVRSSWILLVNIIQTRNVAVLNFPLIVGIVIRLSDIPIVVEPVGIIEWGFGCPIRRLEITGVVRNYI